MNKILGIFGLLVFVCLFTTVLSDNFDTPGNMYNVARWSALHGIIAIGVAFVIITGGIDLSIGSVICLCGVLQSIFIMQYQWSVTGSIIAVIGIALGLGLVHGLMITKLKLQPFVVTLCGLLVYRGFARWYAADQPQGFGAAHDEGFRLLAIGKPWQGWECNLAVFFGAAGLLIGIYSIYRAARQTGPGRWLWATGAGFAALATVISSSQFWGGDNTLVLNIAGLRVQLEPASLFFYLGLLTFVPTAIAVVSAGLASDFRRTSLPTAAVIVTGIVFSLIAWRMAPEFGQISPGDRELRDWGFISASGGTVRNLIMTCVFVSTAALMGAIGWLTQTTASVCRPGMRPLMLAAIVSGIMWLLGMTQLPATPLPMPVLILVLLAGCASIFLNQTIYGRYLLALGRNEEAARYSGINTDRMVILAYVICAGMAGIGSVLFAADINNMQPANHGNIYELYAIAGAVLGGCSLRGGEGSVIGVIIGAAVMRVLYNAINTLGIDTKLEWVVIGVIILTGVIADELVKRMLAKKMRMASEA